MENMRETRSKKATLQTKIFTYEIIGIRMREKT